jgi:hypothetical protein
MRKEKKKKKKKKQQQRVRRRMWMWQATKMVKLKVMNMPRTRAYLWGGATGTVRNEDENDQVTNGFIGLPANDTNWSERDQIHNILREQFGTREVRLSGQKQETI